MKYLPFLTSILIALPVFSLQSANAQTKVNFRCDVSTKVPRTVVKTAKKEVSLIVWESKAFQSSGFTPERRCNEVSDRLQMYANGGSLRYITTGTINNQNVICVAAYRDGKCRPNGLILTLKSDENPTEVLKSLFDTAFKVSGGAPLKRGKGETVTLDLKYVLNSIDNDNVDANEKSETVQEPIR